MKKTNIIYFLTVYVIFELIPCIGLAQNKLTPEPDSKVAEIDSLFEILNKSMKTKDLEKFCSVFSLNEDLFSVGIDINSLAFNHKTLKAIQNEGFKTIDDLQVQLIDQKIKLNDAQNEARYYKNYNLAFTVHPFKFTVDNVRETGVLKYQDGKWIIIQQHASAPITNDVWPAYLTKKSTISNPMHAFSVSELCEDFDLFTLALEEAHPRFYKFNDPVSYSLLKDSIRKALNHQMTEVEFYRLICPVIAAIKCGHTRISLSNETEKYLGEQNIFFPFQLRFISGRAYVLKNAEDNIIHPGSEILSINGCPISEIISNIFKMQGSDGDILTAKYKKLDEKFHELYCQLIGQTKDFTIKYIPYGKNTIQEINVNGINNIEWWRKINSKNLYSKEILKLETNENSDLAVLDIRKFVSKEINEVYGSFKQFSDSVFKVINEKKLHNLIIDLRGNGGGDIAQELIPYLIGKPIKFLKIIDAPRTRYSFLEHTDKSRFFNDIHVNLWKKYRNEEGRYELAGDYNEEINPSPYIFKDKLYVLIDGNSFSGTSSLTAILHDLKRATFFGEETGGCCYGATGGDFLNLTLPNTQVKVGIPIRNDVNNVSARTKLNRGTIPDYEITNSIQDVLDGKDAEMNFVFDFIKNNK